MSRNTPRKNNKRPVESLQHMLLRKASKMSRHDHNYPSLFDDEIVQFNKASKIQKAYRDHSRRYDHCMDVMTNPNGSTKKTLIDCIINHVKNLIKNNEREEFEYLYDRATGKYEPYELPSNDEELQQLQAIYSGNIPDLDKVLLIEFVLESLSKSEIIDYIRGRSIGCDLSIKNYISNT